MAVKKAVKKPPVKKKVSYARDIKKEANKLAKDKVKKIIVHQASLGYTLEEIAELTQTDRKTIYDWGNIDQKFKDDLKAAREAGREHKNEEVIDSLYERATGMKIKKELAFKSKGEPIQKTVVEEELPPDVRAAEYILSTQRKGRWNPKTVIEHEGIERGDVVIYNIPDNNRMLKQDRERLTSEE